MCKYCDSYSGSYKSEYCSKNCYIKSKVYDAEREVERLDQYQKEFNLAKSRYEQALEFQKKLPKWRKKHEYILNRY